MKEDSAALFVTITVKTCCIEQVNHPLIKKFLSKEYNNDVAVRDIAGVVAKGT